MTVSGKKDGPHANHSKEVPRLRRIVGQLEGVERMITDGRACPDILQQLRAVGAAVKALELGILRGHLASCIRRSAKNDSTKEFEEKLEEVLKTIKF